MRTSAGVRGMHDRQSVMLVIVPASLPPLSNHVLVTSIVRPFAVPCRAAHGLVRMVECHDLAMPQDSLRRHVCVQPALRCR